MENTHKFSMEYNSYMAFENSPSLDQPEKPRTPMNRWFYLNRRSLLVLVLIAMVLLMILSGLAVGPALNSSQSGGLDGCLHAAQPDGKALAATVTIGSFSKTTDADGCFFFASLPPGNYLLTIKTTSQDMQVPVTIEANKAVGLGSITVP